MDSSPMVTERINAGARFLGEFQKYAPVQSAFWLKEAEEREWWLYVASEQITDENYDVAYEEAGQIGETLQDPWFDIFQVKVLGADDRLAQAAADLRGRYPARNPIRLHDTTFGGMAVEEVYVYPSPVVVPVGQGKP